MSHVKRGQTWEHVTPGPSKHVLIVLTLEPPKRGWSDWRCLVLSDSSQRSSGVGGFILGNSKWWRRLA